MASDRSPEPDGAGRSARRREDQRRLRHVRERLTSNTGLRRSFDHELLRQYAGNRESASNALLLFIATVGAGSAFFLPVTHAASWILLAAFAHATSLALAGRCLALGEDALDPPAWRTRFVLGEAVNSLVWSLLVLVVLLTGDATARAVTFVVVLLYTAMVAMMAAPIPRAVYAGLFPIGGTLIATLQPDTGAQALMMILMATGAVLYLLLLASRLYESAVSNLEYRAERSALIVELEEAKANSDEARRRAEDANLAKSRFLATMSHELRTPLNAILGFSEVMKGEMLGPFGVPTYREYARDVHASGEHLLNLINEILDLSRIEAGRYELKEEMVSLAGVIEDCRHMLSLRARAKSITMSERVEADLPRLWADERAVRQIVLNLLSNAIKFTPQGGKITLKAGWTASGGQYVTVSDNGPGIPEEEIPVVMSSFGRGALAIKTAEQGSGLGLPIVKGLADLLGARFVLSSTVRVGTDARVSFPAERVIDALPAVTGRGMARARRAAAA